MPKAKINGVDIYYKVQGHGEPLVLIMGLGGEGGDWILQRRAFNRHFCVITFDNRGVGKSDKTSRSFTIKTMADDVIGLMDHLGLDRAHILGVSMGGMIAQEVAIDYPERVKKLILVSTSPGKDERGKHFPELLTAMGLKSDFSDNDINGVDMRKVMTSLNSYSFSCRALKAVAVPFCWVRMKLFGVEGLKQQFEAAMTFNTLDRLHMIKRPTLVITGTEDRILPLRCSELIAERIPDARLVKIEGGSHTLIAEKKDKFNKEVLAFLRGS